MVAGMEAHAFSTPPEPGRPPARLPSDDEVAEWSGVPRNFVSAFARRGEPPTVHVGERYVGFRPEAFERWISAEEFGRLGSYR
jgi:hypothetical protein